MHRSGYGTLLRKALAAYRLTYLFVYEDGPFSVFDWIRYKAGISKGDEFYIGGFWADLLICPLCLSVWFAVLAHFLPDFIVDWLSVAGICLLLFKDDE